MVAPRSIGGRGGRTSCLPGMERPPTATITLPDCDDQDDGWRAAAIFSETNTQRLKISRVVGNRHASASGPRSQSMNETASIPAFYWSRKEHPSLGLPDVQYATLWLIPSGRFRYISCWPGYAWFSAGGTWYEKDDQLHWPGEQPRVVRWVRTQSFKQRLYRLHPQ